MHEERHTLEVSESVLRAIEDIVLWSWGSDGPDEILVNAIPVLDQWLKILGRGPAIPKPSE